MNSVNGPLEPETAVTTPRRWILPLFWMAIGLFFYYGSTQITSAPIQDKHDPGPAAICMVCALGLFVLGSLQAIQIFIKPIPLVARSTSTADTPPNWRMALQAVLAITAYIGALFYVGFGIATLLFGVIAMRRLGTSWLLSITCTTVTIATVYLLFIQLLGIVLPTGVWGLPL